MILKFLKIGAEPVTLVYPIPLVSFLGFCLTKNFIGFFASYLFGMFFLQQSTSGTILTMLKMI